MSKKTSTTRTKVRKATRTGGDRTLRDIIHDAVDETTNTVENIHMSVANLPLDALQKTDRLDESVREAKKLQGEVVGAVYNLVRKINGEIRTLGDELLA